MKIQCDVCDKDEASVFCTADEAALCASCDHRVHHANKLASKHDRFSLLHPSSNHFPVCDVCQERRAFLFCQQDRAILCRECDLPIHRANEHTQKHNRFLLTGVKLSATANIYTPLSSSEAKDSDPTSLPSNKKNIVSSKRGISYPASATKTAALTTTKANIINADVDLDGKLTTEGASSMSSISEYLIETLPGWHVEDLLDSPPPFGLCKSDDAMLPSLDTDFISQINCYSPEIWVPQALQQMESSQFSSQAIGLDGYKHTNKHTSINANKVWGDDAFTVPQIDPSSTTGKRSRSYW